MVSNNVLLFSVVYKFIAMIIGVLGNTTVIIYTILSDKEMTATSYLVGNLALADLLMCLTFYPMWIIELIQAVLNIDNDQDLFCKLSRSTMYSLLFVSVATLLALQLSVFIHYTTSEVFADCDETTSYTSHFWNLVNFLLSFHQKQ